MLNLFQFRNFFLKKSYALICKKLFKIIIIANFALWSLSDRYQRVRTKPTPLATVAINISETDKDTIRTGKNIFKSISKLHDKSAIYYHIKELKLRIFYLTISFLCTFFSCYYYSFEMIYLFVKPFLAYEKNFIFTDLTEAFYTTIKLNFIISIYTLIPFLIYQFWCFVIPSSFLKERKKYNFFFLTIFVLFNLSLIFVYFLLLPELYKFLLNFEVNTNFMTIQLEARIHSYVELACKIFFFSSLLFQMPITFFLAFKYGFLNTNFLVENRAKIFFINLFLAAFVAPPDVLIQILLTLYLQLIIEILLLLMFFYKKLQPLPSETDKLGL